MASIRDLFVTIGFDIDEKPLQQIDRNMRNIQSSARRLSIVFVAASASIGIFLKEAGGFEQTQIAFETMLGSAEEAQQLLKEMADFAAKTPFTLPGVESAAKQLLAVGIESDKMIGTLKALGDVSAGLSVPLSRLALNFGQVKTQGKLTGRELRDFAVAGVPLAAELAKQLNVSKAEVSSLVSAGKIGFPEVEKAFISMTSEGGRFFDLMDKQSKSFFGIMSNILDNLILMARSIGTELLPQAKAITKEFLRILDVNKKLIKTRAVKFFKNLAITVGILFKAIKATAEAVLNVTDAFGGLGVVIKNITLLMLGFVALQIVSGIGATTMAIFKLIGAMRTLGSVALITQAKIIAMPLIIGAAVIALGLIIEDIIAFFSGKDSITGLLVEAFEKKFPEAFGITRDILYTIRDTFGVIVAETRMLLGFLDEFVGPTAIRNIVGSFSGSGSSSGGGSSNNQTIINQNLVIDASQTGLSAEAAAFAVERGTKDALDTTLRQANRALKPRVEQ